MAILIDAERKKGKGKWLYIIIKVLLIIGIPLQVFPYYWMAINTFKSSSEIISIPPTFWPKTWKWSGYLETFHKLNLWNNINNTFIICSLVVIIQTVFSAFAAYSFSRLKPRFGNIILLIFMGTLMISGQALMFPLYIMMANFPIIHVSMLNNIWSYILVSGVSAYTIFLFKNFFDNLPMDLLEAARVDGATNLGILIKIIFPLSLPIFAVNILTAFMGAYNDYIMPMMLLPDSKNWTLMMRVATVQSSDTASMNSIYVLLTICTIPIILVYLFAQKYIAEGISTSGIKG